MSLIDCEKIAAYHIGFKEGYFFQFEQIKFLETTTIQSITVSQKKQKEFERLFNFDQTPSSSQR